MTMGGIQMMIETNLKNRLHSTKIEDVQIIFQASHVIVFENSCQILNINNLYRLLDYSCFFFLLMELTALPLT